MAADERIEELEHALRKDPDNAELKATLDAARHRSGAPDPRATWPIVISRKVHIWAGYQKDRYPTACGKELKRARGHEYGEPERVNCEACLDSEIGFYLLGGRLHPKEQKKVPAHFYARYGRQTVRVGVPGGKLVRTAKGWKKERNRYFDAVHRDPPPGDGGAVVD